MPVYVGTKLCNYELREPIASGGMGEVHGARDSRLGRDATLEVSDERFSDRLERETNPVAVLNHPNLVMETANLDLAPEHRGVVVFELAETAGTDRVSVHVTMRQKLFDGLRRKVP